ncbi:MAG TPA: methyltransferase [Actinocrinis sp.]|nr:methyltransferase [Actinocrinis sp.]
MSGYWKVEPEGAARERLVRLEVQGGRSLSLVTADGVFGAQRVDHGTRVLIHQAPAPVACTGIVDVGTGYGPIAVAMGLREPSAGVWAVDVNRRALGLARRNAEANGARNVVAVEPGEVPAAVRFDRIYSNPPVKIGRDQLHDLLGGWLRRLVPGGEAFVVVKQSMGADSLHSWLTDEGYPTLRAASKQGYRLLRVDRPGTPEEMPRLAPADLATVNRATGQWSVLGRLVGGWSDSVHLLGDGARRAVLKIKLGEWWGGQLSRHEAMVSALRAEGYPAQPVLGFGALTQDRWFLLTGFASGAQPGAVDVPLARQLADAVDLHARVQPPAERDWSAMITMFLNGGIREHHFHPRLSGLAARALDLVPHPVPALPGSEFVHGDFAIRNVLIDQGAVNQDTVNQDTVNRDTVSAVIDLEGFGRGTRTIDLVSLLASMIGHASPQAVAEVKDRAQTASDTATFRACLAHRTLARLLSATDRPTRIAAVAQHARALLALAE